jgi:hypothetical protein
MTRATDDLRARVRAALDADHDRGTLLREMEALARDPDFEDCADLWGPALYDREPYIFSTFLQRHLGDESEPVIRQLLERAEADGNAELFSALYRKVADEETWNAEMLALAQSREPNAAVERAVTLRDMREDEYTLSELAALALYAREPAVFGPFVRAHAHQDGGSYERLREVALQRGDDDLAWAIFREVARPKDWKAAIHRLLDDMVPASEIATELRKRHPNAGLSADGKDLAALVTRYGAAVVPYLEENLDWLDQNDARHLLPALERLGDDALYWSIFFKTRNHKQWNEALRELLAQRPADDALVGALRRRTPPANDPYAYHGWALDADVAEALYARGPEITRPFLERCLRMPPLSLVRAAQTRGDEDFLDFLFARLMRQVAALTTNAYPSAAQERYYTPGPQELGALHELSDLMTERFDRLYARAPEEFVRHAAAMLGRVDESAFISFRREARYSPVVTYLMQRHHDAWCRAPEAVRDLLESPNLYVQIIGLAHLQGGGPEAAARVMENLPSLGALLLDRSRRGTKRLALACLAAAGRESASHAARITPLLEEALHFQSRRAIDERIMVALVRLRHQWADAAASAEPAVQPSA